ATPETLQLGGHASGLEAKPRASIDRRIGAERAAEAAPLRRDVVELPLALEREVTLDGDQAIVVLGKVVEGARRPPRNHATPCAFTLLLILPVRHTPPWFVRGESRHQLRDRLLALADDNRVHTGLVQRLAWKQRRMPAAPDNPASRVPRAHGARHPQRVANRAAG